MDTYPEGTLAMFIQKHKASIAKQTVAQIMYSLALALLDCHQKGICHQDIRPENSECLVAMAFATNGPANNLMHSHVVQTTVEWDRAHAGEPHQLWHRRLIQGNWSHRLANRRLALLYGTCKFLPSFREPAADLGLVSRNPYSLPTRPSLPSQISSPSAAPCSSYVPARRLFSSRIDPPSPL